MGTIRSHQFVSIDSCCFRPNISCYIMSFPSAYQYDCFYLLRSILTRDSRTYLNPRPVSEFLRPSDHVLGLAMPNMFTTDLTLVFGVFCVQQLWVWNTGIVSTLSCISINDIKAKLKWSRYRPSVVQRVGRDIPLLFHDRGIGRGWGVSSTPRPQFSPGKDPVSILQEAGWTPGTVWTGEKSRPHRDSIPDRPARSQSPYGLSYPTHIY